MDYYQALDYLYGLRRLGIKLRLDHVEALLERIGNPHKGLKVVHVGGTNGKGSVCAILYRILREAGYSTGLYTSPHLLDFCERIVVDDSQIPRDYVTCFIESIIPVVEDVAKDFSHPTFFEVTTSLAFDYFNKMGVDIVVLEVGLGGRLDATNIVKPLVSVITNVGVEHTDYLGETLDKIVFEKAGIIKPESILVTASSNPLVTEQLSQACREKNTRMVHVGNNPRFEILESGMDGSRFNYHGRTNYHNLHLSLVGEHQVTNAATSLAVIEALNNKGFNITEDNLRTSLASARWPGRLEIVQEKPLVVLDSAHNNPGVRQLVDSLRLFDYENLILVMGVSRSKPLSEMVSQIAPKASLLVATNAHDREVYPASEVQKEASKHTASVEYDNVCEAVEYGISSAGLNDMVLVCGSVFVVGEAYGIWHEKVSL